MHRRDALSRRSFLAAGSAAASFLILPRRVLGAPGEPSANERLQVASVGVGGMGSNDIRNVPGEQVVAICDVDDRAVARSAEHFPEAKRYRDYREMLEVESGIDAVMVATPDHNHAAVTLAAIRRGKHVFCQKPLTHTVQEALEVTRAAKEAGVATQMGNQGQAGEEARLVREYIACGAIGAVREIHSWSNRRPDISPRGVPRPADTPPVPAEMDWNLWLGSAPERPYHPTYHPFSWRGWWDFGSGVLGDIACHNLSAVFKALQLGWPTSVEASSTNWNQPPEVRNETAPRASIVTYTFAATEHHPDLVLRWYDGGMMPPTPAGVGAGRDFFANDGTMVVGDEGILMNHRLLPEARSREIGKPPRILERSPGHYQEWVNACKGGPAAGSNFVDHAGPLAAVVQMGKIAIRTEEKLLWDPAQLRFSNSEEGNRLLNPPRREGWPL